MLKLLNEFVFCFLFFFSKLLLNTMLTRVDGQSRRHVKSESVWLIHSTNICFAVVVSSPCQQPYESLDVLTKQTEAIGFESLKFLE